MTARRLDKGGLIDRGKPLSFTFDGRQMQGFAGDSLASALLANGQLLMGRSFKYHRPRGVLTAGSAEPNALVTLGRKGRTEPNARATMVELYQGLEARSQNRWPSLALDFGAITGLFGPILGAGFYYKTFMWPAGFWERVYEPLIRRAAGLGRANYDADPDAYEKSWAHCDLLVIGAGPAGLAAALTAARSGARVILADEGVQPGGSLLSETADIDGQKAPHFAAAVTAELAELRNVTVLPRTTVFGWYDGGVFGAVERVQKHVREPDPHRPAERLWRVIAKEAILASGAEERPLVFGGNDRPGVMMAGAMRCYVNRYAVAPGQRVAIFTNGAYGYRVAEDLEASGLEVAAIIDPARDGTPDYAGGAHVIRDAMVTATHGGRALKAITVRTGGRTQRIAVDALGMSGGWNPIVHLACQRGAKPQWSQAHGGFLPPPARDGLAAAGSAAGVHALGTCLADGAGKAAEAVARLGFNARIPDFAVAPEQSETAARPLWRVRGARGKAFVDFQNDVHVRDLHLAAREGYGHVELAKRYTTTGMATDQGRLSNVSAVGILAEARGVSPAAVGMTTFRPFYTPVSFGALAGAARAGHFRPVRKSPLHGWAGRHGAVIVEAGLWLRPAWFARAGEATWRESVDREARAVRGHVGLCDVSTLGKIEIFGAGAAEFLDRVYCNPIGMLPVGRARYGIMLREDGFILDDGTVSRLGAEHYVLTTTTAMAGPVAMHLEFCAQALWPELDVRMASVTDQWAQMAIAGPKARTVLQEIVDEDIGNGAFSFLAARDVPLCGRRLQGRLFRISFSGELAYELAVPAGYGEAVAEAVMEAGAPHGIVPYGTEALGVLRIEKGHVSHGEIDGTVTPGDLGLGRMVPPDKRDFIGKAMLRREGLRAPDRPQLVGLKPANPADSFGSGAHILGIGEAPALENDQGHVTSSCFSPHLGHTIGLALVKRGPERLGEEIVVWDGLAGTATRAVICDPVFVDPQGERLRG